MSKELDPFVFGKSQAAINLSKILTEEGDFLSRRKVTRFLNKYCVRFKQLMYVPDLKVRESLLIEQFVISKKEAFNSEVSTKISTHMVTTLSAFYKWYLKKTKEQRLIEEI